MQLKVVQNQNGELLFVESNADFVNLLMQVKEMPIGNLSKIANNGNAIACLQDSLPNLPSNLFGAAQQNASASNNSMDLESLLKQSMIQESPVTEPISLPIPQTWNMNCQGSSNGPYTCTGTGEGDWNKAVAFRNVGTSFEIAIKLPENPFNLMLGILPDDANLQTRLNTQSVFWSYGCFLSPCRSATLWPSDRKEKIPNLFNNSHPVAGKELRMRYYHESQTLEYSYDGSNKWHKVKNPRGYSIEEGTVCCPVLLVTTLNPITVTEVKSIQPTQKKSCVETPIPSMMFVVTNELKVMTIISLCWHLEWLKQQNISLSTLKTSSVTFGSDELKKMICAVMNGKRNVLEAALEEHLSRSSNVSGTNNEDRSKSAHPIPVVQVKNDDTSSSNAEDWTASGDY